MKEHKRDLDLFNSAIAATLVRAVLKIPQADRGRKYAVRPLSGGIRKCLAQALIKLP